MSVNVNTKCSTRIKCKCSSIRFFFLSRRHKLCVATLKFEWKLSLCTRMCVCMYSTVYSAAT